MCRRAASSATCFQAASAAAATATCGGAGIGSRCRHIRRRATSNAARLQAPMAATACGGTHRRRRLGAAIARLAARSDDGG